MTPSIFGSPEDTRLRGFFVRDAHSGDDNKEMAKSKLRCLISPQNTFKGSEIQLGDCASFYQAATQRSPGRWVGPAEVIQVERDSYRSGLRRIPRSQVHSYTPDLDFQSRETISPGE